MLIGEALKRARERKGLRQSELAEKLYVDPSLVCRWEKGQRRVSLEELTVILEVLEISFEELKNMCCNIESH
jgi:transcriptional regulator with XRE-family HTH domain